MLQLTSYLTRLPKACQRPAPAHGY
jgi:hypothetical protein